MSKIVHVPYTYHPDPVGGTEIYVEQLVDELGAQGVENLIFAPGKTNAQYQHRGVVVQRLAVDDAALALGQLYGEGDVDAAHAFGAFLDTVKPTIVHLHAFTRIVSSRMAEQAQRRAIPVVFTYHTPAVSCMRTSLMRWGSEPCDGILRTDLCARCRLHSLGLPIPFATLVARTPKTIRAWSGSRQGGVWTALRMRDLVSHRHHAIHALVQRTDCIVALCEWTRKLLVNNEVAPGKIVLVPHGLSDIEMPVTSRTPRKDDTTLRIAVLGRLDPVKGIQVLVKALSAVPELPLTLDIYGISQSETETPFARDLRALSTHDSRIRFMNSVPHSRVLPLLQEYDILAVPSQWFETGPLVVLEAFAAGIPVLGSNLGGIAEKIQDGVNGMLVEPLDVNAWRDALTRLASDRALVAHLRSNVRPPRSMRTVAQEINALYIGLETNESSHRLRPIQ